MVANDKQTVEMEAEPKHFSVPVDSGVHPSCLMRVVSLSLQPHCECCPSKNEPRIETRPCPLHLQSIRARYCGCTAWHRFTTGAFCAFLPKLQRNPGRPKSTSQAIGSSLQRAVVVTEIVRDTVFPIDRRSAVRSCQIHCMMLQGVPPQLDVLLHILSQHIRGRAGTHLTIAIAVVVVLCCQ